MELSTLTLTLVILNLIFSFFLLFLIQRTISHYNALTKGTNTKDLLASLNQLIKGNRNNSDQIIKVDKKLEQFIARSKNYYQKLGFHRFNPFSHTGGDQSFILCLLDENDSGIVISSLHSRENTRVYAKRIIKGASPDQILSKEEKLVISQTLKS